MKTHTGGAVPIMNQYDTCQLVQKWLLVCWGVIVDIVIDCLVEIIVKCFRYCFPIFGCIISYYIMYTKKIRENWEYYLSYDTLQHQANEATEVLGNYVPGCGMYQRKFVKCIRDNNKLGT